MNIYGSTSLKVIGRILGNSTEVLFYKPGDHKSTEIFVSVVFGLSGQGWGGPDHLHSISIASSLPALHWPLTLDPCQERPPCA